MPSETQTDSPTDTVVLVKPLRCVLEMKEDLKMKKKILTLPPLSSVCAAFVSQAFYFGWMNMFSSRRRVCVCCVSTDESHRDGVLQCVCWYVSAEKESEHQNCVHRQYSARRKSNRKGSSSSSSKQTAVLAGCFSGVSCCLVLLSRGREVGVGYRG